MIVDHCEGCAGYKCEMESQEGSSPNFNINLLTVNLNLPTTAPATTTSNVPVLLQTTEASQMLPPPTADVPSSSKASTGKSKPPGKVRAKEGLEKNSDEYIRRRQRNNVAVKKSRERTREKSVYTLQKVEQLKVENEQLESKISTLTKELSVLKDLFMDHARGFSAGANANLLSPDQLESLLGCKVIRTETNSSADLGTSSTTSPGFTRAPSTMDPLINVAEIELMSFKNNTTSTTMITEVPTQNADNTGHDFLEVGDDQGTGYVKHES